MASPVVTTRTKSTSPPIVSTKTSASTKSTITSIQFDDNLEELITVFISLILNRSKINERNDLHLIIKLCDQIHLEQQIESNKCHIASTLIEIIKKCLLDHYLKLEQNENYLLNELITTQTSKDLQYLANLIEPTKLKAVNRASTLSKITIDVYLLPSCCFNQLNSSDNLIHADDTDHCKNYLIERWTFIMITNKKDNDKNVDLNSKSILSLNELFQAIKSYLHFSQISSCLNQSKGQQASNIAYSVTCSNELDSTNHQHSSTSVHKYFDYKSFPSIAINHENNHYLTSYSSKSCLNQLMQLNQQSQQQISLLNTLVRIDLFSKKRFDLATSFNCLKLEHQLSQFTSRMETTATNTNNSITNLLNSTSFFTNNTSMTSHSEEIPQLTADNQIENDNELTESFTDSENNNNNNYFNRLPLSFSTKNLNLKYTASFELSSITTSDEPILQQDNNNNNMFNNLNKFKQKTTNCCSLKPVTSFNNCNNGVLLNEPVNYKQATSDLDLDGLSLNDNTIPINIVTVSNQNKLIKVNRSNNLPLSSSPAPLRKSGSSLFDFDISLKNPRSIKNALSLNILNNDDKQTVETESNSNANNSLLNDYLYANSNRRKELMSLNPNHLLGSFEESLLNGRMNPVGVVDGFYAVIGASGSFFPEHATLPVNAAYYQVCEDIAASPYLGIINLASLGKRGYKVPSKGTIQVTLFNPNNTVVKMFIVMYDLSDMPPGHRTFLRQRTMYVPLKNSEDKEDQIEHKSFLRYLIHLRFSTSKSGKIYLHTDIKLIFARDKCEIDPSLARYEYKTLTEAPQKPKYSPKK